MSLNHRAHLENDSQPAQGTGLSWTRVLGCSLRVVGCNHSPGQELVEFAILVPILVLFVFGAIDLGRLFHAAITITNASREGARFGMSYPADFNGIRTATRREAQGTGIDLADPAISAILISCPPAPPPAPAGGCARGTPIRVTVTYDFELIMGWLLPSPIQLGRYAEMLVP